MIVSDRPGRSRGTFRKTLQGAAVCAALALVVFIYLAYFTPEKRAVRHRLSEADHKSVAAIETRIKPLTELFAKGRKGSRAFAEESLSWGGKWEMVKGMVDGDSHRLYLSESFARHVFSSDEMRAAIDSVVRAYMDDIEGIESEMLVHLRADLAEPDRPAGSMPFLRSDEEFRREYRNLSDLVTAEMRADLGVTLGRELGVLVATEVATQAALAAATDMGVSAGVLSAGAASTVATLGVGMVVAFIIDYIVDLVFKMAGYDPVAKIETLVKESIDKMENALVRDAGFFSSHPKGALRLRMEQLHAERSKLRRETIARFMQKEGGK